MDGPYTFLNVGTHMYNEQGSKHRIELGNKDANADVERKYIDNTVNVLMLFKKHFQRLYLGITLRKCISKKNCVMYFTRLKFSKI